jgi:branched-subunit amino acid aminotransferase/4-amino-4-deoxychorismate lyase
MRSTGCYTTARVSAGRIERLERHAGRLRRDAERLSLPLPDRRAIESLALAVVRAELGRGDGVLRIEWGTEGEAKPALRATTRPLGPDPRTWRVTSATTVHPGPVDRHDLKVLGVKPLGVPAYDEARGERARVGVDEVLLFDASGRLVEGSRSNLIVVSRDGLIRTPARSLGAVEGLGLEIVRAFAPEIRESTEIGRNDVTAAAELIATNGVRGAVAIVELDHAPIGDGRPGPFAIRLRGLFFRS